LASSVKGFRELELKLANLARQAPEEARQAVIEGAEVILERSQELVPRDTEELAESAFISPPRRDGQRSTVTVGYGAPYALVTHENPRAGKTGGKSPSGRTYPHYAQTGQWKWLETAYKERGGQAVVRMGKTLTRWIHRGGR